MSNHRHNHINLILITQNYIKSIPSLVRSQISKYMIFKMNSSREVLKFYKHIRQNYRVIQKKSHIFNVTKYFITNENESRMYNRNVFELSENFLRTFKQNL